MSDPLDASVTEVLRRDAYQEIGRVAEMADHYAVSLSDAVYRCDLMATAARLQQLRFCVMGMIQTFNLFLRKAHDQDVPEGRGSPDAHREDQRTGDVVS